MGTFTGHVVPGAFFILFAMWNLIHPCMQPRSSEHIRYISHCHQLKSLLRNPLFIEGLVKFVVTFAAAVGELWWGGWKIINHGRFVSLNNYQHATMYSFFGLAGLAEMLSVTCIKLRSRQDKLFQATAFFAEGFLFYFHLHERSAVDVRLHILLVLATIGCCVGSALEGLTSSERGQSFFRYVWIVCTFLQGTWFIQTGFILYNPWLSGSSPWAGDELSALSIVTTVYAWHVLLAILITAFINTVVTRCVQRKGFRPKQFSP
ncbi:transmembrane protein 45B-like [Acanthaster planci]|uniref:Transmembrane protein 45B-like n=1 Tax=Acanthaster planci TaxID=133434 RepID=A0A8B7Z3T1_ACAPL|nr:transmembrane protein 45B-like [Acanthaster planci]